MIEEQKLRELCEYMVHALQARFKGGMPGVLINEQPVVQLPSSNDYEEIIIEALDRFYFAEDYEEELPKRKKKKGKKRTSVPVTKLRVVK